ncbi:hypothetical protein M1N81_03740 [Dehalococcoidia bacterium]|nr:hypothetical protein [Dehalococcoidia bacterium]
MKTKHRILSVLTVLALVASLSAVMVSPAAAAIVGLDVVSVVPHVAGGADPVYTIRFAITKEHKAGDLIVVTFPADTTVPPADPGATPPVLWDDGAITVQGVDVDGEDVSVIGRSVLFEIPTGVEPISAGGIVEVVFTALADLRNPTEPGTYVLKVRTVHHPFDVTSDHYTIGGITIDPKRGPVGTDITVTGVGFVPGESVTVTFDEPPIFTRTVTAPGGTFTTTFAVPAGAAAGAQPVRAVGAHVDHSVNFTVEVPGPVIALSPDTAVTGTTVTVSGENFPKNARLLVRWNALDGMLVGMATTDGDGKFSVPVPIPRHNAPGDYAIFVHVEDDPGVADDATLTIPKPVIDLTPDEGPVRQPVTVTGENFPALSTIVIRWKGIGDDYLMLPPEAITNSLGAFSTQVTVPVDLSGPHDIYAYVRDFELTYDKAPFTIEPGVPRIGVRDGFHAIWEVLDHSVWVFREGEWYQHHTDPVMHALIDPEKRFEYLEPGLAYWFYLTEPIENVLVGGVIWTLSAGWHNRGWTP